MIARYPLIRFLLDALTVSGRVDGGRESAVRQENRYARLDTTFVLVAGAPDGRWEVFQREYDKPQASFDEFQKACDFATDLARTRAGAMILIRRESNASAGPDSSMTGETT